MPGGGFDGFEFVGISVAGRGFPLLTAASALVAGNARCGGEPRDAPLERYATAIQSGGSELSANKHEYMKEEHDGNR